MRRADAHALAAGLVLAGCQAGPLGPMSVDSNRDTAVAALQTVNSAAAKCWFGPGNRRFSDLRMVPELDTTAGRPRLLIVRAGRAEGLPAMVIEASGAPVAIETYGPLTGTSTGGQINGDVARWAAGDVSCRA